MKTDSLTVHQRFRVAYDYPVIFTRRVLAPDNTVLRDAVNRRGENRRHRAAVYLDAGVMACHPRLADDFRAYAAAHAATLELAGPPVPVPGGEAAKTQQLLVEHLLEGMLTAHLDRQSYVIAVGGGAVLDAVGMAAALAHRGLRLIRLPTTVLAQNDAGIGVKNGINFNGGKNAIGVFAPPFAVINDADFLATLDDTHWIGGVSEAFKVALIKDAAFFDFLCTHADAFRQRDPAAMEQQIRRCAELHLDHIATNGDPFEYGRSRPLDFGHWAAHQLEALSGYRLPHGHAVATGIALDAAYANLQGWLAARDYARLCEALLRCGFMLWHEDLDLRKPDGRRAIYDGIERFREHLGGELCITFPDGVGARREEHALDLTLMDEALERLRTQVPRRP